MSRKTNMHAGGECGGRRGKATDQGEHRAGDRARGAAPGVDGVSWQEYETDLDEKLADLRAGYHRRAHVTAHRRGPDRGSTPEM